MCGWTEENLRAKSLRKSWKNKNHLKAKSSGTFQLKEKMRGSDGALWSWAPALLAHQARNGLRGKVWAQEVRAVEEKPLTPRESSLPVVNLPHYACLCTESISPGISN